MNHEAIRQAHPAVQMIDDSLGAFDKDGNKITIDDAKVAEEAKKLETEWKAKKYQRDRIYPDLGSQLDMIYWDKKNNTKNWEEAIDKVKSDHPKP